MAIASQRGRARVAVSTLNQWAMDFDGNLQRTLVSCAEAREMGARYRVGPELELSGYTCEDHFLEPETTHHSCESLAALIKSDVSDGLLVDVGLPFSFGGVLYNCRALVLDRQLLLLRPKTALADDLCYRESRWFSAWPPCHVESAPLPPVLAAACGVRRVPFGDALLELEDTTIGIEMCEELFLPTPRHVAQFAAGASFVANGNGSHHEVGKQHARLGRLTRATEHGGVYLYSNLLGCDGGRMYFDGGGMVVAHGALVAMGEQYSMQECETIVASVELDALASHRPCASGRHEANRLRAAALTRSCAAPPEGGYPRVPVPFALCTDATAACSPMRWVEPSGAEQLARAAAVWLWDHLRRSAQRCGFFLAVSGGADSSAVAATVALMTAMLSQVARGEHGERARQHVTAELRRIVPRADATDPRSLCEALLHLSCMASQHNSDETRCRAELVARQLGAHFTPLRIDEPAAAIVKTFIDTTGRTPTYGKYGGVHHENNLLSQVYGRLRMVTAYMFATAGPWARGDYGTLLVLGSANADEHNRGYNDRYDCSAADINPIGSANKQLVRELLRWCADELGAPVLREVAEATPLSETEPAEDDATDEADMGMSYPTLSRLSSLRKVERLGPLGAYRELRKGLDAEGEVDVARQVKLFFFYWAQFRHLMTSMPPSMHATDYNPDDNRHDLRPFLLNCRWTRQFRAIDDDLAARGLCALLPQSEWADGCMTVPRTMSGHFRYPRRSNVEIGHKWAAYPDPPPLSEQMPMRGSRHECVDGQSEQSPLLSTMSDAELEAQLEALQVERARRKQAFAAGAGVDGRGERFDEASLSSSATCIDPADVGEASSTSDE